jgi:hypothetical protein
VGTEAAVATATVHHLPCGFDADAKARVSTYFLPEVDAESGRHYVLLRGRRLEGHRVTLPAGAVGLVVTELPATASGVDTAAPASSPPASAPSTLSAPSAPSVSTAAAVRRPPTVASFSGAGGGGGYGKKAGGSDSGSGGGSDSEPDWGVGGSDDDSSGEDDTAFDLDAALGRPSATTVAAAARPPPPPARRWEVESSFLAATYWLHDKPIADSDPLRAAADWIDIARAVHGPAPPVATS